MSFLEEVGIWKIFQFQFFQLFFLRISFLFFLYITIYILSSYRVSIKGYCPMKTYLKQLEQRKRLRVYTLHNSKKSSNS